MTINVLFLAAESEPFVKVGGLGDVAGALPDAISQISVKLPDSQKVYIRLVLPYHFAIKQKRFSPEFLGEFVVEKEQGSEKCRVYRILKNNIPVYFLDGDPIDEKSPIYSSEPILDGYKYVFFSLAAIKLAEFLKWRVDILQANDWHTATAIYALHLRKNPSKFLNKTKTILSLHNLPFMGFGVQQALTSYGIPPSEDQVLPEWARHAPLPLGLLHADKIIAVSPHYAEEILTPEFGCSLEKFLLTRKNAITGIINGLDTEIWNSAIDPYIKNTYDSDSLSLRKINKTALQKNYKLEENEDIPLLTLISRMDPQKGIDIALRGLKYLKDLQWQAIILGTGIPFIEEMAKQLESQFPDRVRSIIDFNSNLAHQLYAGADIFMMPSRYEPCGLSQMISMRYGCVPVARSTGGLADTINHVSHTINGGTGFLFNKPYPSSFASELRRAMNYYQKAASWSQIQLNGMKINFSWEVSAKRYIEVYKQMVNEN